jgi:hypothetical protein
MKYFNWTGFTADNWDDFADSVIRVMEFYNFDQDKEMASLFDDSFELYYQNRLKRGLSKDEARVGAAKGAISDITGGPEELAEACKYWLAHKDPEEAQYAMSLVEE